MTDGKREEGLASSVNLFWGLRRTASYRHIGRPGFVYRTACRLDGEANADHPAQLGKPLRYTGRDGSLMLLSIICSENTPFPEDSGAEVETRSAAKCKLLSRSASSVRWRTATRCSRFGSLLRFMHSKMRDVAWECVQ
ncbi:MAG: hypothetical protein R6X31_09800 [Anaerolineae bacterium]